MTRRDERPHTSASVPIEAWRGCYRTRWNGLLTDESMDHPAKFDRDLITRIIMECRRRGWVPDGGLIGDPCAGVASGGIIAAFAGYRWFGVELEQPFVEMAETNIERAAAKLSAMGHPIPHVVQGDSRQFAHLVATRCVQPADAVVLSPPYRGGGHHEDIMKAWNRNGRGQGVTSPEDAGYGDATGQIANLKEGCLDSIITSLPFGSYTPNSVLIPGSGRQGVSTLYQQQGHKSKTQFGEHPGQLGALDPAKPPVNPPVNPPVKSAVKPTAKAPPAGLYDDRDASAGACTGATYWSEAAKIMRQCFVALRPGGKVICVVKDYVKERKIVRFSDQFATLMRAVGFHECVRIRAMMVDRQVSQNLFGERTETVKGRKSHFRRIYEARNPDCRIDHEDVLVMERPSHDAPDATAQNAEASEHATG